MIDKKIYSLLMKQDQQGLKILMTEYGGLICYIIKQTIQPTKEDLAECMSDVMFKVWKSIRNYNAEKSSLKSWLVMVSKGVAIDYLRKQKNIETVSLDENIDMIFCMDYKDNMNLIISAMQQLSPPDNVIYYKRFIMGDTIEKIAEDLNLTRDAVYKRISRAKDKLKALLVKEGYYGR